MSYEVSFEQIYTFRGILVRLGFMLITFTQRLSAVWVSIVAESPAFLGYLHFLHSNIHFKLFISISLTLIMTMFVSILISSQIKVYVPNNTLFGFHLTDVSFQRSFTFISDCRKCSSNFFQCVKSNFCIPKRYLCDGYEDCSDGSDEEITKCGLNICDNSIKCFDGRCIPKEKCCLPSIDPNCSVGYILPCCKLYLYEKHILLHPK
ncbi:Low-density lipoprotein receptor-related protein 2 [Nymphon striatum]|nr:Low-density lipoprotein receptor-related protein 2 [Nymphon striatum]